MKRYNVMLQVVTTVHTELSSLVRDIVESRERGMRRDHSLGVTRGCC